MGLTGELVKTVFSKNRSLGAIECNRTKSFRIDRSRWSLVRSYICGDEFNSVLAVDEATSIRSSEDTVTQSQAILLENEENYSKNPSEKHQEITEKKENPTSELSREVNAAIVIQSAYRTFLVRRLYREIKQSNIEKSENQSPESVDTSIEVQTGDNSDIRSVLDQSFALSRRLQQTKRRSPASKIKEDWDASTMSTNEMKLRIQSKLEATTRRERALAYAFAQQLRTCSAKKKTTQFGCAEVNMGWSWLERWMATRLPDTSWAEDCLSKTHEPISSDRRPRFIKKMIDMVGEEKESSCSNDVANRVDSVGATVRTCKDDGRSTKHGVKAAKSVPRRRTVPSQRSTTHSAKVKSYSELNSATDFI